VTEPTWDVGARSPSGASSRKKGIADCWPPELRTLDGAEWRPSCEETPDGT